MLAASITSLKRSARARVHAHAHRCPTLAVARAHNNPPGDEDCAPDPSQAHQTKTTATATHGRKHAHCACAPAVRKPSRVLGNLHCRCSTRGGSYFKPLVFFAYSARSWTSRASLLRLKQPVETVKQSAGRRTQGKRCRSRLTTRTHAPTRGARGAWPSCASLGCGCNLQATGTFRAAAKSLVDALRCARTIEGNAYTYLRSS